MTAESLELEKKLVELLKMRNFHISAAESCTGGMLASNIISVPGASEVIEESYITYSDRVKVKLLGVKRETLEKNSAVSAQTALEMAVGCAQTTGSEAAISLTGYAGPSAGEDGTPAGTVFAGCYLCGKTEIFEFHFAGDRMQVRKAASKEVVKKMIKMLDRDDTK